MAIDGSKIRSTLLEVVDEHHRRIGSASGYATIQQGSILQEVVVRLGNRLTQDEGQALLTAWYDLFRTGHISWGYDLNNPNPPFCHVTKQGRRALEHLSRDPWNPDGYISHLASRARPNSIAFSYVQEALRTYNANCFRATAVMIGAAAESMALELRDAVVAGVKKVGRTPAKDLSDFRIKRVIDALHKELEMQQADMPAELYERVEGYWPAFTQQIRGARNDAGHPASIDPVTPETVHAALLIFPELADLTSRLLAWVPTHYK